MMAWILYAIAVSAALAAAGWCAERLLSLLGRPTRWSWAGALAGSVIVPLAALRPRPLPDAGVDLGAIVLVPAALPAATDVLGPAAVASVDWTMWIAAGWVAASAVLAVLGGVSAARLAGARRGWRPTELEGADVLVSRDTGPAVVGVLRPRIVIPAWALDLPAEDRSLMLRHEREHIAAGDPLLYRAAALALLALPWNAALWWQLHRLRAAIEVDCDARVVRAASSPARYARLLIEVGAHRADQPRAALALSPRLSSLERRIRAMTSPSPRHRVTGAVSLAVAGIACVAVVAAASPPVVNAAYPDVPSPTATPAPPTHAPGSTVVAADTNDVRAEPRFTPYEVAPEVRNRDDFQRALIDAYPPDLREEGVGGRVILWLFVDEDGRIGETRIADSSGRAELDEAALRAAREVRFAPALRRDEPVAVWVQFPVVFQVREDPAEPGERTREPVREAPRDEPAPPVAEGEVEDESDGPTFTPFEQAPEIRDRAAFAAAMRAAYPATLRDAGVGGTAIVWIRVDDAGRVTDARVERSSGHDELDRAATEVLRATEFAPGVNRGNAVPVWVQFPVRFQPPPD